MSTKATGRTRHAPLYELLNGGSIMTCCGEYTCICVCPDCGKPSVTGSQCLACSTCRECERVGQGDWCRDCQLETDRRAYDEHGAWLAQQCRDEAPCD